MTQCTCSKAKEFENPVQYCRDTHELYVNHTGQFILCRLGNEHIDFFEDIKNNDIDMLKVKISLALHHVSSHTCKKYLVLNNV